MPVKNTRGVQQEDVRQAADMLIAEGLRPTIERVRQKMGRGSPNTVGPLLDVWFASLAGRLGVDGKKDESQAPEPVQQAAIMLWQTALQSAREEAVQALAHEQQILQQHQSVIKRQEADLQHQQEVLMARQQAVDEALKVARSQLTDMSARLDDAVMRLDHRDSDITVLREKLSVREKERDASLLRSEEEARRHAEERSRLEARASANERRLLEGLDRERQEAKRLKAALAEVEHRAEATRLRLEAASSALITKEQAMAEILKTEQLARVSAKLRSAELLDLLDAQKSAHATQIKQLNLLLVNSARKPLLRASIRRRRI